MPRAKQPGRLDARDMGARTQTPTLMANSTHPCVQYLTTTLAQPFLTVVLHHDKSEFQVLLRRDLTRSIILDRLEKFCEREIIQRRITKVVINTISSPYQTAVLLGRKNLPRFSGALGATWDQQVKAGCGRVIGGGVDIL